MIHMLEKYGISQSGQSSTIQPFVLFVPKTVPNLSSSKYTVFSNTSHLFYLSPKLFLFVLAATPDQTWPIQRQVPYHLGASTSPSDLQYFTIRSSLIHHLVPVLHHLVPVLHHPLPVLHHPGPVLLYTRTSPAWKQIRAEQKKLANAIQSEPIIIVISHNMIIHLYHIVSITDNGPKRLSYHPKIWYVDLKNYHIISEVIFKLLKFIISNWKWYFYLKYYQIISKMIFLYSYKK